MTLEGIDRQEIAEAGFVAAGATMTAFAFLSHLAIEGGVL